MAITHEQMRDVIVQACNTVGFPAPLPDTPLTEWADESLDQTMRRGSPQWKNAHHEVITALECATLGEAEGTRAALKRAQVIAVRVQKCLCKPPRGETQSIRSGAARWCIVCGGKK